MLNKLKSIIPNEIKDKIVGLTGPTEWADFVGIGNKNKIFVMLSGQYQNLGDVAIAQTQIEMLKKSFPGYAIPEISSRDTYASKNAIKSIINHEDIIVISGGGNMSDSYISLENARRYIIKNFKDNRIVSFPQTIDFGSDEKGIAELKKSREIYNSHPNLTLFARDKKSYEIMKSVFDKVKVLYCPDVVLSNKNYIKNLDRSGILLCVRQDNESAISQSMREGLISAIKDNFDEVSITDTVDVSIDAVSVDNREKTLANFLKKFSSAKVVVTDRLHGLIFSVITKTPCLAIPNKNQKITSLCNEELKDFTHIKLFKDGDDIIALIKELYETYFENPPIYDNDEIFEKLIESIKIEG